MRAHKFSKLKNRFSQLETIKRLMNENFSLRTQQIQYDFYQDQKTLAWNEYVNTRITQVNAAIRATNARKGEKNEQLLKRLQTEAEQRSR